jgi:hypothetical protein
MLNILLKVFHIIVNTNTPVCQQFLKVHDVNSGNFAGSAKADMVLLKEGVGIASLRENRHFSAQVRFCEG